jgi:hypothetical protein
MADEKVLFEALASPDFKVSIHDKKRTESLEIATAEETKKQFGEDLNPIAASETKNEDTKSLMSAVKGMPANQRQNVIETLKQSGLGDPLTTENLIQNSFTVDKAIRNNPSN